MKIRLSRFEIITVVLISQSDKIFVTITEQLLRKCGLLPTFKREIRNPLININENKKHANAIPGTIKSEPTRKNSDIPTDDDMLIS